MSEAPVRLDLQRMVTRITDENLLGYAAVARIGTEIVIAERRVGLRILILRQELRAVRDHIQLRILAKMTAKAADVRDIDHGSPTNVPLDTKVRLIGGIRFAVRIDVTREAARRQQARSVRGRRDGPVVRSGAVDRRRIEEQVS